MQTLRLKPLVLSLFCLFSPVVFADELNLTLQPDPILNPPASNNDPVPLFIRGEQFEGHMDKALEASGDVELRKRDQGVYADWMRYDKESDEVLAKGNVRLKQPGSTVTGPELQMKLESSEGYMLTPEFQLSTNNSRGDASNITFEGKNQYRLKQASYTTCPVDDNDWFLRVRDLDIDKNRQVGTAKGATIIFKGVPILYTPWMDFPLNDARKSGLLTPTFGTTGNSGAEFSLPYYWNIAPNRDYTITPRVMVKRGLLVGNQFRYLETNYSGEANYETLPNDKITNTSRYSYSILHNHDFLNNWTGYLNIQKVSDDNYFKDLSSSIAVTSQTNLPREGTLTYSFPTGAFTTRVQRYQTLQDPLAPVLPPYARTPQLLLNSSKLDVKGADLGFTGEYVHFDHPTMVTGNRTTLYPTVSYPIQNAAAYITPKAGVHMTQYALDRQTTTLPNSTRSLPIFSLDSGLTFERDLSIGNQAFLQTIEPRLYYVYIPYRNQNDIPLFDTGLADFNFAQLFSENRFVGGDRINDANQVTVAITSRLLEPSTGNERVRVALGQRFYLRSQQVTLTPSTPPPTDKSSDYLVGISAKITQKWATDAGLEYNPNQGRSEKISFGMRYQPELGKVLNLGYRYSRDVVKQLDFSSQWPLGRGWYGVTRINYSLPDRQIVEGLAGLEYNGGCWVFRIVGQRFAAGQGSTHALFLQLELNGLSKLGSNPLDVLSRNISGYTKLNEPVAADPSSSFYQPKY